MGAPWSRSSSAKDPCVLEKSPERYKSQQKPFIEFPDFLEILDIWHEGEDFPSLPFELTDNFKQRLELSNDVTCFGMKKNTFF